MFPRPWPTGTGAGSYATSGSTAGTNACICTIYAQVGMTPPRSLGTGPKPNVAEAELSGVYSCFQSVARTTADKAATWM